VELPYALARRSGELRLVAHDALGVLWEVRWPDGRVQQILRPAHVPVGEGIGPPPEDVFLGRGSEGHWSHGIGAPGPSPGGS